MKHYTIAIMRADESIRTHEIGTTVELPLAAVEAYARRVATREHVAVTVIEHTADGLIYHGVMS